MRIERAFTVAGSEPYEGIGFRTGVSEIRNPDGSVVFRLDEIEVPSAWSQVAVDVLAQKYFRKAGIAARLTTVDEPDVPAWLRRRRPDRAALEALPEDQRLSGETSAKQVFDRLAGTWTWWGWKGGYFDSEEDARAFFDELRFMLASQHAAPNSPQWFNTGLFWAYGIDGPAQGHYFVDDASGEVRRSESAYERPQPHACFIQSIQDDLVNPGGIMDLWVREARLFKYGSGTGTNFSSLRGENEPLSGGGKSSGLMSFLKIGDRAAGAIKSGGTTRRAAKMVVVDVDHPDILDFVGWKVREEQKVAALVAGSTAARPPPQRDPLRLPCRRPRRRGALQPQGQSRAPPGDPRRPPGPAAGERAPAGDPVRPPGLHPDRDPDLLDRLGLRGLRHRRRAELQQLGAGHRRVPRAGARGSRVAADPAHRRQGREHPAGAPPVGPDRARRLGQRRPRRAVRHHDQRVAHLPRLGPDQRLQSVLGVHVPRRHGVQSRLAQPGRLPEGARRVRRRRLRACGAAVDHRARDLGHDGPVPLPAHRRAVLPLPHARPRLRQPRRPADGVRHRLRQPQGAGARRAL